MQKSLPRLAFFFGLCAAIGCFLSTAAPPLRAQGLPREKGAFYLEDFLTQPYRLRVLTDAPIYFNADAARFLGTVRRDQLVELQAVTGHGDLLRVKGQAQQGQVVGWMPARYLTPLDPSFVEGLRRAQDRQESVRKLAAANEIALNMTTAEVASILGQPAKKSSHADADGTTESWVFVRYEQVPRQVVGTDLYGRAVVTVVYEKVAVGSNTVTFAGGVARAIDQTDKTGGAVAHAAEVKTVPPPVAFHF